MEKKQRVAEFRHRGPAQAGNVVIFKKYLLAEILPLTLLVDCKGKLPGTGLTLIQFRTLLSILVLEEYDGWATKKGLSKMNNLTQNSYYFLIRKLTQKGMLDNLPPGRNRLKRYVVSDKGYDHIRVFMRLWNNKVTLLKNLGYDTLGLPIRNARGEA